MQIKWNRSRSYIRVLLAMTDWTLQIKLRKQSTGFHQRRAGTTATAATATAELPAIMQAVDRTDRSSDVAAIPYWLNVTCRHPGFRHDNSPSLYLHPDRQTMNTHRKLAAGRWEQLSDTRGPPGERGFGWHLMTIARFHNDHMRYKWYVLMHLKST